MAADWVLSQKPFTASVRLQAIWPESTLLQASGACSSADADVGFPFSGCGRRFSGVSRLFTGCSFGGWFGGGGISSHSVCKVSPQFWQAKAAAMSSMLVGLTLAARAKATQPTHPTHPTHPTNQSTNPTYKSGGLSWKDQKWKAPLLAIASNQGSQPGVPCTQRYD